METTNDLSTAVPVVNNLMYVPCKLADAFKVRAILDSGSTSCLISTAYLEMMPELRKLMKSTVMTYSGVDESNQCYAGIINKVSLQLTQNITV